MRIGCVTRHSYPTAQEVRVTKFAETLSSHGHEFFVFCPAGDNGGDSGLFEFGRIVRLYSRLPRCVSKLIYAPLPINPMWMEWFHRQFRKFSIDIVIVRDLRLALPAFLAARACGIKAILDLGEHYPGMMEVLGKQNFGHYVIRNRWLIRYLERLSVNMADWVWVVVDENKIRLQKFSSRISVISNYPVSTSYGSDKKVTPRTYSTSGDPVTLVSLGLIDNIRGLDLAIEAFAILVRELGNLKLIIYGDGFFKETLEERVMSLGLEDKIVFGGWIAASQKYEVMVDGDIGLLLHKVCELTQHTIPNKLFDYMGVGLPVVSTKLDPVTRILESEKCGISVSEDAIEVADSLKSLILNVDQRKLFSDKGYKAIRSRYKWSSEEEKIIDDISFLTKAPG